MKLRSVLVLLWLLICAPSYSQEQGAAASSRSSVEQWGIFEQAFAGPSDGNPFTEVDFGATFRNGANKVEVRGFYDGGGTYRVRFMPGHTGEWSYQTRSNRAELDGKAGTFQVVAATGTNHGPVRMRETFHFAYADGTPYFPVGTTCYAWIHQPDALQQQTLKTLSASPFNKLRMCLFPKSYVYNRNEPEHFPFIRGDDGKFDFSRFDPDYWRHLERRLNDLSNLGIQADLILFHPYDRWGFAEMDDAADDRYVRYAIARLSAFRNVWWSLANEYDLQKPPHQGEHRGNKEADDWERMISIVQKEDPHGRMRSIHNWKTIYDFTSPALTHASIQHGDLTKVGEWRKRYGKPVIVDECGYEGNVPQGWGRLTGQQMLQRFWVGTLSGGYVGHGETMNHPEEILWWSKGGTLHGESPSRIAFLRQTMEALPYTEMSPSRPSANVFLLAKPGSVYLAYATKPGVIEFRVEGEREYEVEAIDTWAMKAEKLEAVAPGEFRFTAPRADFLLRLTAQQP